MSLEYPIKMRDDLRAKAESGEFDAEDLLDAADMIDRLGGTIEMKALKIYNLESELTNVRAEIQRMRSIEGVY